MKITVFGTGHMGSAFATALKRTQHEILLRGSSKGSKTCSDLCHRLNLPEAETKDLLESDIIVFVMPSNGLFAASKEIEGYSGTIISVVGFDNYLSDDSKSSRSASETIADLIPSSTVVHGFTWMSAENLETPSTTVKTSVVHCSDNEVALDKVCHLTKEMGLNPIKAGRLKNSRYAEAAGFLWGAIAFEGEYGVRTFFEVHPEKE